MANTKTKLLLAAALIAMAGCAKKKPADLPPPPPTTTAPAETPAAPPAETGPTPGSRADFIAQSGTDTVYFGTDAFDLDGEDEATLAKQAAWLQQYANVSVTVEGHCDERGTREYNLALGDRRANAAKNYLVNHGVAASRVSVISYGKERPIAMGSDETAWAQNRRAVTVLPQ